MTSQPQETAAQEAITVPRSPLGKPAASCCSAPQTLALPRLSLLGVILGGGTHLLADGLLRARATFPCAARLTSVCFPTSLRQRGQGRSVSIPQTMEGVGQGLR